MSAERDELVAQYEDAQRRQRVAIADEMRLRAAIRALDDVARPEFPTDAQREGIKTAVQRIRDAVPSKSHHGDPCGPKGGEYVVTCETERRRINVFAKSPFKFDSGERQWKMTRGEIESLRMIIEAQGCTIFDSWQHDDGVGFIVGLR